MSLGAAVKDEKWKNMLRYVSKQMTQIKWIGTRAFNHFVLFAVLGNNYHIEDDNALMALIRACFVHSTIKANNYPASMKNSEICREWCDRFNRIQNNKIICKLGFGNVMTHSCKEYETSVKNYLVYGLRDIYVRSLKKLLNIKEYKIVGLNVLLSFVKVNHRNYTFILSDDDKYYLKKINLLMN